MKSMLLIMFLILITGCVDRPFTGYIVCKEYTPLHMSDEIANTVQIAAVFVPHKKKPHLINSKWTLYVANKSEVKTFDVDSLYFSQVKCGQLISIR